MTQILTLSGRPTTLDELVGQNMYIRWRRISGSAFEVSDSGVVRRCVKGKSWNTSPGKILKVQLVTGRRCVQFKRNNVYKFHYVAVLIAEAFLGKKPKGLDVNHMDGIKTNDCLLNLEYVTRKENICHSVHVLGNMLGEKNGSAKLTEKQVRGIKDEFMVTDLSKWGALASLCKKFSTRYGVNPGTVRDIGYGKTWVSKTCKS